jgi:hypothetical protein
LVEAYTSVLADVEAASQLAVGDRDSPRIAEAR